MVKVTFTTPNDKEVVIEANAGDNLMAIAVEHDIEGVAAECGGACACATCHVKIDTAFKDIVGEPNEHEASMLELCDDFSETSRLSCQVELTDQMDGLKVTVIDEL